MEEPLAFGNPKKRCVCASSTTLVLVFVLVLFNCFGDAKVLPNDEVQTLRQITTKYGIKQWNVDKTSCPTGIGVNFTYGKNSYSGIACDCSFNASTICHVTAIDLKGLNISGPLPEELANLPFLRSIDLRRNFFSGSIPASWFRLNLTALNVLGNVVSGPIPQTIATISTLEELVLQDNLFVGPIPRQLEKLTRLKRFLGSGNNFTGVLPRELADLKNLTDFRISGTSISGRIPDFIGNWTKLEKLYMEGTSMLGPIPSSFALLTNLTELRISDLQGPPMPFPKLQTLTKITDLILRNCSIVGPITPFFGGQLLTIKELDLSFNRLNGTIPSNFDESRDLQFMYLTNNSLTGQIPTFRTTVTTRSRCFDLSYNNFSGPDDSNCQEAKMNRISSYSPLDNSVTSWCLKKDLPCPGKAKHYSFFINCGGPRLSSDGEEYELDADRMGPSSFFSNDRWAVSTTGDFLGDDRFIVHAATEVTDGDLYKTARRAPISLKYFGLCLRKGSYKVKLHFAEIMFVADQANNTVGKRIFDVAIQGQRVLSDFNIAEQARGIDKKIVREFDVDVTGSTLEIHLYWTGKGTTNVPDRGTFGPLISAIAVTPNFDPRIGLPVGTIIGIVVGCSVAVLLVLAFLWKKGCLGGKDEDIEFRRSLELQTSCFSLRQMKDATCNFDPANKIGEGGFGPVYKGTLPEGSVIAVKQLSSKSKQGNREFVNEIGMISALKHPNLVKLFGCCIEGNQLLLIYEYMENNSLANALFGGHEKKLNLDWPTRHKICVGIARGLAYLHEESGLKIVHRDIKATNVLLDKDLNAKISDFGLAKLDEGEKTHISTRIAGTIGYMAPEYAMRGYLTDKADVYSFGIVALEIVSGKSNTNYMPKEEFIYLLDWAYVLHEKGNLLELVDPALGSKYPKTQALRMLELGLLCANPSPTLRPSMSAVVSILEGNVPIQAPIVKRGSMTDEMRFKAFEKLSQDSLTEMSSSTFFQDSHTRTMEGPWVDSSISLPSQDENMDHKSSERLLP